MFTNLSWKTGDLWFMKIMKFQLYRLPKHRGTFNIYSPWLTYWHLQSTPSLQKQCLTSFNVPSWKINNFKRIPSFRNCNFKCPNKGDKKITAQGLGNRERRPANYMQHCSHVWKDGLVENRIMGWNVEATLIFT